MAKAGMAVQCGQEKRGGRLRGGEAPPRRLGEGDRGRDLAEALGRVV
jgi:hypothetical protein